MLHMRAVVGFQSRRLLVSVPRQAACPGSRLWQPDAIVDRKVMPTLARIILEQTAEAPPREEDVVACDVAIEEDYKTQLY